MQNNLNYAKRVVVGLIIIFALLFLCGGIVTLYYKMLPTITIQVNSVTIRQDEEVPELEVQIQYDGKEKIALEEDGTYSAEELVNELKQGHGYSLKYEIDNTQEGSYLLQVLLDENLEDKLMLDWKNKINYEVKNGRVEVLSKYGDWEGEKFRFLDDTYASGWVNLDEHTYYFDEEGKRVTGKCEILGNVYYFKENGRFDNEKNKINPNRPMVAITFDDGPGPYTMELLKILEKNNARATFFMVGYNVENYPKTIQKMVEIGCELGNHSTNHIRLAQVSAKKVAKEINTTNQRIEKITGQEVELVRPPYGSVNETVQETVKQPLIMWSVDTLDWESKNANSVKKHVMTHVEDGDIVLLHDIHETTVQAVARFIPELIEQGYQLVTVSEMAKARGVSLEAGQQYYSFKK